MDSSLLYHAWGLRGYKCTRTEYKDNNIIGSSDFWSDRFKLLSINI